MTAPTREQLLQWVRDAEWSGLYIEWAKPSGDWKQDPAQFSLTVPVTFEQLQRFAALAFAAGQSSGVASGAVPMTWTEGAPPKPWSGEWFIAETTYGDRVVLTELPDEYAYDYKTADHTYLMADKVARWMQFPDSEYKDFAAIVTSVGSGKQFVLEMENTKNDAERAVLWPRLRAALISGDSAREDAERLEVELAWQRFCWKNVRMLAARHRKEEWAQHMLRFCDDAGVKAIPLRDSAIDRARGGGDA